MFQPLWAFLSIGVCSYISDGIHIILTVYTYTEYLLRDIFTCISEPCCRVGAKQIQEIKRLRVANGLSLQPLHKELESLHKKYSFWHTYIHTYMHSIHVYIHCTYIHTYILHTYIHTVITPFLSWKYFWTALITRTLLLEHYSCTENFLHGNFII